MKDPLRLMRIGCLLEVTIAEVNYGGSKAGELRNEVLISSMSAGKRVFAVVAEGR